MADTAGFAILVRLFEPQIKGALESETKKLPPALAVFAGCRSCQEE